MKKSVTARLTLVLTLALSFSVAPALSWADTFKVAIMQAQKGAAAKYRPMEAYLKGKGIDIQFVGAKNYPDAARMFASGEVDGMFSGSGVAGSLIIKGLADPAVRPVEKSGNSTYWAVVVAPKGAPKFTGSSDWFKGKKVLTTSLASSGEFYVRSLPGFKSAGVTLLPAASHDAAVDALSKGAADAAVVKNRVWDKIKGQYPGLAAAGQDKGENPDNTLMISKKADKAVAEKVSAALLAIEKDASPAAEAVRNELGVRSYIKTGAGDFKHNLALLKAAGVDKSFNFEFK